MKQITSIKIPKALTERQHPQVNMDYLSFDLKAWEEGTLGGENPYGISSAAHRCFEMGRRGISPFDLAKVLSEE